MTAIRRVAAAVVVAALVTGVAVAAGWRLYVHPQTDPLHHADAVLVLGGYDYARYPFGMGLAASGWAPNLVISNPKGPRDAWLHDYCEQTHNGFNVYCFEPEPATTRGEAADFARLADEKGWASVIVVTFRPHVSRARFIMQRCFDGRVTMAESPATMTWSQWVYEYLHQTAGFARAALSRDC